MTEPPPQPDQAGSDPGHRDPALTSASLLSRVGHVPLDEAAWAQFVDRYAPEIYAWCRSWHLQAADAEDVTQAVLVRLVGRMRRFEYDHGRSFRGWLRTLAENALRDWAADRQNRPAAGGEPDGLRILEGLEAREDLLDRLGRQFDLELLEEAARRVRECVSPTTWEAYRLQAVEGLPAAEAAARLGLRVAAAMKAKSNVLKRLREASHALGG